MTVDGRTPSLLSLFLLLVVGVLATATPAAADPHSPQPEFQSGPAGDADPESEPGDDTEPDAEPSGDADPEPQPSGDVESASAPGDDADPPPVLSADEERARLKQELKEEILEELREAPREQDPEATPPAAEPSPPVAATPATEEKPNPLLPPKQLSLLVKHPVDGSKSTYVPGTGLHIESADGRFAIATRVRAQLRYQVGFGEGDPEHVLQLRRARLQFKGHAFNKHNKFKIELAFSPRDLSMKDGVPGRTPLLTWYLEFDYLRDLTVRAGQYKIPYSRQRVVSSGDLQLVDRALANGEFNHDRDIGFDIRSKDLGGLGGYLKYYVGVYMGEGRDFGDKNATPDFRLHYLGRIEVQPFGKFQDYQEADMDRSLTPKLSIGAAYSFHHGSQGLRGVLGTTPEDEGTTDYHSMTADYVFKVGGFSSTGEFHLRMGERNPGNAGPVTDARNGMGWFVQAGFLIPRIPFEVAARYSGVTGIGDETSLSEAHSAGGGISYYVAGHPWKIQADFFHEWDGDSATPDSNLFRTQLQLAF